MEEEIEEYTDCPPSHVIYEGKNHIYIKNKITLNTLSISKNNLEMNNINIQTSKNIFGFNKIKVYGILGIINLKNTPCLIFGNNFECVCFYLDKAVYVIKEINYIILINTEESIKVKINEKFEIFKKKIMNNTLLFSNYYDLTLPYYQQNQHNLNEVNSFFYNYEIIKPFLFNNNIKYKNEFYSVIINGYIDCYNHSLSGQEMILYTLYRKRFDMNFFECEITITYSTDVFNYIYGIKFGNDQFNDEFIKEFEKKNGILFDCSNNGNENEFKKIFSNFDYIKYNYSNFEEKNIEKFIEEQNKEIKKTQYYYTCKDPLTGKIKGEYRQKESNQNSSCIFIFGDLKNICSLIKFFNYILFINYFSKYQKTDNFENQKNKYIKLDKISKIEYFYAEIKKPISEYIKLLKKNEYFNYNKYLYINTNKNEKTLNLNNLTLFIGTYNVSAIEQNIILSKFNVSSFLFPEKFSKYISIKNLPDIIYICFEEIVELNANNILLSSNQKIIDLYTKIITSEICKYYPYNLKIQKNLVGILTLIYIKAELDDHIDNINIVENKSGNFNLGNKGNFIIKFKINHKEFALVNGHLTAGDKKENFEKRIKEMEKIFDIIYENNNYNIYYFIVGDLNFRISLEREQFNLICCGDKKGIVNENQAKKEIETLKKFDQLNTVKNLFKKEKLFEEKINFPPTYKYEKMQIIYNEKRTPSWTDRILFKEDKNIKCIFYDTLDLYISDHKPLVGLFNINLN